MDRRRLATRIRAWLTGTALMLPVMAVGTGAHTLAAAAAGQTRMISSSGTAYFSPAPEGSDAYQNPEFLGQESDQGASPYQGSIVDRSASGSPGDGGSGDGVQKAKSNPRLVTSFDGLNHRNQRLANHGNQFSVEPPDQGLCAGNGFVMESVNDVLRVFDTSGQALMGVVDLNTFYGYQPAINRTTHVFGPFVTDPSCYFDPESQRWFQVVLTLDTRSNGRFTGGNHLDIAVSQTASPLGAWNIYRLPVQDDGTQGTPDHGCSLGPCLGDYPHIGADANGFFVTTNEYSFFGPEFTGAQVYAFSKRALAAGTASLAVTQFDTRGMDAGNSGFTLWPATTPGGAYETGAGGTEYFMSSNAADEAHGDGVSPGPRTSNQLLVWAVTNTSSLDGGAPALAIDHTVLPVGQYGVPPRSDQKAGSFPLGQCLNDTACSTFLLGAPDPYAPEVESPIDSNDSRMLQVTFANGKLWGALDTALTLGGASKAGIEWFVVKPSVDSGPVGARTALQGYLGLPNNNLTYPAIGVAPSGRGVMAFTIVGADHFPSAGYAGIDAQAGVGDIQVAREGAGPDDGFSDYKAFGNPAGTTRPRWGDYGATAVDGNSIWIASEYIGQTCTLAQYTSAPFGSCGGTRTSLGNWDTRISLVTP